MILRYLLGKSVKWGYSQMERDARAALEILQGLDDDALALSLAMMTDMRHRILERLGWDLLRPRSVLSSDATATMKLVRLVKSFQKQGDLHSSASLMIWIHTMRASGPDAPESLRRIVIDLWEKLHSVDDLVETNAFIVGHTMRKPIRVDGFESWPDFLQNKRLKVGE